MTILSFEYQKKDSETYKEKVFIPIHMPSDKYFGIDITELDFEDQGVISAKLEALQIKYRADIEELMSEYDLKHCYRYFFPEKMRNVVTEE